MRRVVQDLFASIACMVGVPAMWRWFNRRRLVVLVYHGVVAEQPPGDVPQWHLVTGRNFERQIAWLRKHYDVVDLDTGLARLERGQIDRPTACVTFDDGYLNNCTVALPVLARHRVPATIFLVTGMVGTDRSLWTVELERAFRTSKADHIDLRSIGLGSRSLPGLDDTVRTGRDVIRALKKLGPRERNAVVEQLHAALGPRPDAPPREFRMMEWDDVRALERTGLISLGAHTVNHEIVSRLDDETLEFEIAESLAAVRARVERPSLTFAYPNGGPGDYDARAASLLERHGSRWALTTIPGLNDRGTARFEVRRITVENHTGFARFRLAVSGFIESFQNRALRVAGKRRQDPGADGMTIPLDDAPAHGSDRL